MGGNDYDKAPYFEASANVILSTESLRPPLTGIGNYTFNLLQALILLSDAPQIKCFTGRKIISSKAALEEVNLSNSNSRNIRAAFMPELRGWMRNLPAAYQALTIFKNFNFNHCLDKRLDYIYHDPGFILRPYDGPSVTTIHDLSFIVCPETQPVSRVRHLVKEIPKTLKQADRIITPSYYVRDEVIRLLSVSPHRVIATPLGVSKLFHPRQDYECRNVLSQYGLKYKEYLLFVGTIEPRKNLDILLDAWLSLPSSMRKQLPLVIAGLPGWSHHKLMQRINDLSFDGVTYLNYVATSDLPLLYAGAIAFIYPSLYEGFGLPVLEAMASGIPVICSTNTATVEFSSGSAFLVDADDVEAIRNAIIQITENRDISVKMSKAGILAASRYTWERCARETTDVYKSVRS